MIDYLEGFCLGSTWTDSDYNERRHPFLYLTLGFILLIALGASLVFPSLLSRFLFLPEWLHLTLGLFALLALPFAAAFYHRLQRPFRALILLAYLGQYVALSAFLLQRTIGILAPHQNTMASFFLDKMNGMINKGVNFFAFLGGLVGNLVGIMSSALLLSLLFLVVLFLLLMIPTLYLLGIKGLQRLWDNFVIHQFFPKRLRF